MTSSSQRCVNAEDAQRESCRKHYNGCQPCFDTLASEKDKNGSSGVPFPPSSVAAPFMRPVETNHDRLHGIRLQIRRMCESLKKNYIVKMFMHFITLRKCMNFRIYYSSAPIPHDLLSPFAVIMKAVDAEKHCTSMTFREHGKSESHQDALDSHFLGPNNS